MSWLTIVLEDGRTAFEPGERVRGTVSWLLDEAPGEMAVHLLWYTEGKGTQDVGLAVTRTLRPEAAGSAEIDMQLPEGPWSFSGKLVSLQWAIELVAGPAHVERQRLVVGPGRREVLLHGQETTGA